MPSRRSDAEGCSLLRILARLFDCRPETDDLVMILRVGAALGPGDPNPKDPDVMAKGDINQRFPVILNLLNAAGGPAKIDGDPIWTFDPADIADITTDPSGQQFINLRQEGVASVTVEVDADRGDGVRLITGVGQVIANDPASDAVTVEIEFGPAEPIPPAP